MSGPCRGRVVGLCPTISWLVAGRVAGLAGRVVHCIETQSRVAASPSPVMIQTLYRNTGPCRAPCRAPAVRVAALLRRVARRWTPYRSLGFTLWRHKVAPLSATIQLLYCDPAPCRAHCASCRARARPYHGPTTPCRGLCHGRIAGRLNRVMAKSWPVHERPYAASLPSLSQYSLLYCDLTKKKFGQ